VDLPRRIPVRGARLVTLLVAFAAVACNTPPDGVATVSADCAATGSCPAGPGSAQDAHPASAVCVSSPATSRGAVCAPRATPPDAVDEALGQVGFDRCTLGHSAADLSVGTLDPRDPRAMSDMLALFAQPLGLPAYGASLTHDWDAALASTTPVTSAILAAAARRGTQAVQACDDPTWYKLATGDASPLATALADVGAPRADVTGVPRELQIALAPIVRALAASAHDVTVARKVGSATQESLAGVATWMIGIRHFDLNADTVAAMDVVDVDAITVAAVRVAAAVERADLARFAGAAVPDLTLATPFGPIVLRGPGKHTYEAGGPADGAAFVLDTGGDDVYRTAIAASSITRPVAVAVDLGGNDTYAYAETPVPADHLGKRLPSDGAGRAPDGRTLSRTLRQGAGVLGVGLLFDLGKGNDTYRSLVGAQGVGTHGVGVLYDQGGDDSYVAEGFAQGAAAWGIGLLLDAAGNDTRAVYVQGQGFGFTRGLGALVDVAGNDTYVAYAGAWTGAPANLASDMLYPSSQLAGPPTSPIAGNMSFSQGCGAGHRWDWPDPGFPSPGGIGVLYDASGDDTYGGGVMAQGIGFVQGLGMLLDARGNDAYDALYYAQGAGVHMGLALFDEGGGNDTYDARLPVQTAALGVATDLSGVVHVDRGGDDSYHAPDLSLGAAEDNSVSVFVAVGGSDDFAAAGAWCLGDSVLGDIDATRKKISTVGVFVKAGGQGRYEVGGSSKLEPRSGKSWGTKSEDKGNTKAVGLDRPNGTATL
jgi:hypothetical protein